MENAGVDEHMVEFLEETVAALVGKALPFITNRPVAWIASGLTACAAECGRLAVVHHLRQPSVILSPSQYCREPEVGWLPMLVSYKGRNNDICAAAERVGAHSIESLLLVGMGGTKVEGILSGQGRLESSLTLPPHPLDRGFVTVRATLALAIAATAACHRQDERSAISSRLRENLAKGCEVGTAIAEAILTIPAWESRRFFILGGPATSAARLAWERAFAESALASVIIGDLKDYTHGRYLSALREGDATFVLLSDPSCDNLVEVARAHLSQAFPVVAVPSHGDWIDVMLTQLFAAFTTMSRLAQALSLRPENPPKPPVVAGWTNWGKIRSVKGNLGPTLQKPFLRS